MPAPTQSYEVLLDFTNDTHDNVTIQLSKDYGRNSDAIVLLNPAESITLILDSGSIYRYAVKTRSNVADVIARTWRDTHCDISHLFAAAPARPVYTNSHALQTVDGVVVDRLWRDHRCCIWNDS